MVETAYLPTQMKFALVSVMVDLVVQIPQAVSSLIIPQLLNGRRSATRPAGFWQTTTHSSRLWCRLLSVCSWLPGDRLRQKQNQLLNRFAVVRAYLGQFKETVQEQLIKQLQLEADFTASSDFTSYCVLFECLLQHVGGAENSSRVVASSVRARSTSHYLRLWTSTRAFAKFISLSYPTCTSSNSSSMFSIQTLYENGLGIASQRCGRETCQHQAPECTYTCVYNIRVGLALDLCTCLHLRVVCSFGSPQSGGIVVLNY